MAKSQGWRNRVTALEYHVAGDIQDHPHQWRTHPKAQSDALRGVLEEVGVAGAMLVYRSARAGGALVRIDGHGRKDLDPNAQWPCLVLDVDDREADKLLATYDPISAQAGADAAKLDELLRGVSTGSAALQQLLSDVAAKAGVAKAPKGEDAGPQIDRAEELLVKWGVALGQVWEIPSRTVAGQAHRLMIGDSTKAEDVARLMDGRQAALLATDPPYNVSIEYGDSVDDDKSEADYEAFTRAWFGVWRAVSERQIVSPGCYNLARWCRYFAPYHVAPWTKTNAMTNGKVSRWWCWEPVLFFGDAWIRRRTNDVFEFAVPPQKAEGMGSLTPYHPCPKPLPMWVDLIDSYSEPGDIVAEAFSGSGTTHVAAEQLGRLCYGMELEPKYGGVILERLAGLGLTPRLATNATEEDIT